MNIFKLFSRDLEKAISHDIKIDRLKQRSTMNMILFAVFTLSFIYAKPLYIYFKGRSDRKEKILRLKEQNKYILDKEVDKLENL
jgi:hypothetical protein